MWGRKLKMGTCISRIQTDFPSYFPHLEHKGKKSLSNQDSNPWEKRDKQNKCYNCLMSAEKESLGHMGRGSLKSPQGTLRIEETEESGVQGEQGRGSSPHTAQKGQQVTEGGVGWGRGVSPLFTSTGNHPRSRKEPAKCSSLLTGPPCHHPQEEHT